VTIAKSPYHSLTAGQGRKTLSRPLKGVILTSLDDAILCDTFKRLVSKIEQEVVEFARGVRTHHMPVGRAFRAHFITRNLIKLSPFRCDLAESTLAPIPPLVIGRAKTVAQAIYESQKTNVGFRKILELEWIHKEAQQNVFA